MNDDWYIATSFRAEHPEIYEQMRAAIIEKCAQVAESYPAINSVQRRLVAAAIRALKDKL